MSGAAPTDWRLTARQLLAERKLSEWEREFLQSVLRRQNITDRQADTIQRIADDPGVAEIAARLNERIEMLTVELVGEEPTDRGKHQWRFYPRGGLVVQMDGDQQGVWCSHGEKGIGGDALDLVRHLRGCDMGDAIRWAKGWLRIPEHARSAPQSRSRPAAAAPDTIDMARRLWRESIPAAGTIAETYLASRGLTLPTRAPLRFHPECPRRADRHPAMLAMMSDPVTTEPCGVHRTFLRGDGRGKIEHGQAKMMAGRAGVIRLVPDADVALGLGLAEGIETSLAIMQLAGWSPVWACGSAGAIAKFPVLAGIETITIFADRDDGLKQPGLTSAKTCADRWVASGREATIEMPPGGTDWLDALVPPRRAA